MLLLLLTFTYATTIITARTCPWELRYGRDLGTYDPRQSLELPYPRLQVSLVKRLDVGFLLSCPKLGGYGYGLLLEWVQA